MVHICQEKYDSAPPKSLKFIQIEYKGIIHVKRKLIWKNLPNEKVAGRCFCREEKLL